VPPLTPDSPKQLQLWLGVHTCQDKWHGQPVCHPHNKCESQVCDTSIIRVWPVCDKCVVFYDKGFASACPHRIWSHLLLQLTGRPLLSFTCWRNA
jgi:hypothetical protein